MNNKKNLGIIGLIALAIIAGVLIYRDTRGSKIEITGDASDTLKNLGIEMTGDGKVEIIPIDYGKLPPAPALVRPTDFSVDISPELRKSTLINLGKVVESLKKDPSVLDNWINLGLQRKQLGDYDGAREAWEYAKVIAPSSVVPWHNLGDLYHFYLKDYKKSEENWKKTIVLQPDYSYGYRGLYELYSYSMKEKTDQIPVVLKQGIINAPQATDIAVLLSEYEKSVVK